MADTLKELVWLGSSYRSLRAMPAEVQDHFGHALHLAQAGRKHEKAKPLEGFGSAGVLEMITIRRGDTFRAVYTVKIGDAVCILHCFQKHSKQGIATPKADMDLIRERIMEAVADAKGQRK